MNDRAGGANASGELTSATGENKVEDLATVAANVASRVVVLNVSIMAKANGELVVPAYPSLGEMTNSQISLSFARVRSGGFSDELAFAWLAERSSKTFNGLATSSRNSRGSEQF